MGLSFFLGVYETSNTNVKSNVSNVTLDSKSHVTASTGQAPRGLRVMCENSAISEVFSDF